MSKPDLSLKKTKKVCGVEVKKMPLGTYLEALNKLQDLPQDFINNVFEGKSLQEILDVFSNMTEEILADLIFKIAFVAPRYLIDVVSDLTKIDKEVFLNDENIGLNGLTEIILAFIEVNELGKFMKNVKSIQKMVQPKAQAYKD